MAEQEEDFSKLPLPERFSHKNWKVRKEGYEAATKEFKTAQESDPIVRDFTSDSELWKAAVADSNVAAQQEALVALCAFLEIAGTSGCKRTRSLTIAPIVEKGLTGRPAAKQAALEALMLYIELDKADPVIEELIPLLSHKQPKIIAATLSALTSIYHAYGCKTVEPKPIIKLLPKVFGHADKNVRAEGTNLTVEFYRWLKEAMKPLFWSELKPVQQQDLEKLFEKVKDEPAPKQERLLRSQQEAQESAPDPGVGGNADEGSEEEEAEIDLEPEIVAVDVFPKIPSDFNERLASTKWKDRKEALDDLHTALNHPAIQEGPFDEIVRGCAKSMKDANIAVVTVAANCIELLAKGLRRAFAKYRSTILSPMLERLKEKKQSVTDALAAACDAVAASTSIAENLEEIMEFMKHKNPQVKLESARFLTRSLKMTKEPPQAPEVKSMSDAATKLLADPQETTRNAGAEVLGVLWKIMGDRNMLMHIEGVDDIKKTKIKEYCDQAEVKAKWKPKAAPAPKPAAAPATTKKPTLGKRPTGTVKKPAPAAPRPVTPEEEAPAPAAAPLAARPTSRPGVKTAPKTGLQAPSTLKMKKPGLAGLASPSPRKTTAPYQDDSPAPQPRALASSVRGLASRPLAKPAFEAAPASPPPQQQQQPYLSSASGLSNAERAELSDLRSEVEYLRQQNSDLRTDKLKLNSQLHELQSQNAQLIEDHTRDLLGIKAKETQLVRARSEAENAEERAELATREVEKLKREVGRLSRAESYENGSQRNGCESSNNRNAADTYTNSGITRPTYTAGAGQAKNYSSFRHEASRESSASSVKENVPDSTDDITTSTKPTLVKQHSMLPHPTSIARAASNTGSSSGRASPAMMQQSAAASSIPTGLGAGAAGQRSGSGGDGVESWRRAAEVTQNLKARIEMMKAKQQSLANRH